MEALLSISGMVGAACCVGMYAAVSLGRISAEKPMFFVVNAAGAVLVLLGASHKFDWGDTGTIGQELIWAIISLTGAARAWIQGGGLARVAAWRQRASWSLAVHLCAATSKLRRSARASFSEGSGNDGMVPPR